MRLHWCASYAFSPNAPETADSVACAGLKNRKGAKDCDVVTPEWVKDSIANKQRMPLQKR